MGLASGVICKIAAELPQVVLIDHNWGKANKHTLWYMNSCIDIEDGSDSFLVNVAVELSKCTCKDPFMPDTVCVVCTILTEI